MNRMILCNVEVLSVVSFEVRTEYLNRPIIEASFGAKRLTRIYFLLLNITYGFWSN
jgi:hypothetical protein